MSGLAVDRSVRTTLAFVKTLPGGDRDFSFYRAPGAVISFDPNLRPAAGDRSRLARGGHLVTDPHRRTFLPQKSGPGTPNRKKLLAYCHMVLYNTHIEITRQGMGCWNTPRPYAGDVTSHTAENCANPIITVPFPFYKGGFWVVCLLAV